MSQNIVAICDVDDALLDEQAARSGTTSVSAAAGSRRGRRRGGRRRRRPRRAAGARAVGGSRARTFAELRPVQAAAGGQREVTPAQVLATQPQALRRRADPEGREVSRLPRDAREAEGHRRRHRRDARSHARGDRVGGDGARQARLRAEAAVLVGARSAAPGQAGRRQSEGRHADGQPGPLARRGAARTGIPGGRRDRRHQAKCTSGPTARSATGRRASRVRPRRRRPRQRRLEQHGGRAAPRGSRSAAIRCRRRSAWDLFLGVAPDVEYHPIYHPFNWRGWVDWGQGALGDMGAHLIDHPVWGLELGLPTSIETISTPFNKASATRTRRRPTTSSRRGRASRP